MKNWKEMAWVEMYDIIQNHNDTDDCLVALVPIMEQERILAQIELLEDQLQSTSGDIPRESVEKELKKLKTVTTN